MKHLIIAFVTIVTFWSQANSAEFVFENDPVMGCWGRIEGIIEKDDSIRLGTFLKLAQEKEDESWGAGAKVRNGYRRICLNSVGGSFREAIKMAKMIYPNWGTAVGKNRSCLSACSIVFMSGSRSPEDHRGIIADRVLHPLGKLGFHAPSLKVSKGNYTDASISKAYDVALRGMGQLHEISGDMKILPSLIGAMIATPPSEMMYIETVRQAARWHITIAPSVGPDKLSKLAVFNACNNQYLFVAERITFDGQYENDRQVDYAYFSTEPIIKQENDQYSSTLDGFGKDGLRVCRVMLSPEVQHANVSRKYVTHVGWIGFAEEMIEIYAYQFFGPSTLIKEIARADDTKTEQIDVFQRSRDIRTSSGRCLVFSDNVIVDNEICTVIEDIRYVNRTLSDTSYIWPSGGKTIIEQALGDDDSVTEKINGVKTELDQIVSFNSVTPFSKVFLAQAAIHGLSEFADCWLNTDTNNTFCFQK